MTKMVILTSKCIEKKKIKQIYKKHTVISEIHYY